MSELLDELRSALGDRYVVSTPLRSQGAALEVLAHASDGRSIVLHAFAPPRGSGVVPARVLSALGPALALRHERLLPILDAGCTAELVWIASPRLEGAVDLATWLAREGRLPFLEAARVLSEVAEALEHAHAAGAAHLDLCPEHVLWHGGHALVAGCGVRPAVDAARGAPPADPSEGMQRDLRAFGRIGYQVLAGEPPPPGAPSPALVRPHVPPGLARALVRCLEDDPRARWPDSRELARALRLIVAPSPVHLLSQERERARYLRERRPPPGGSGPAAKAPGDLSRRQG